MVNNENRVNSYSNLTTVNNFASISEASINYIPVDTKTGNISILDEVSNRIETVICNKKDYENQKNDNTEIYAVIGANYGDEGKGLVTNWLSEKPGLTLNILYNGGMQRGHTVERNGCQRHVFHCFGSGTFNGAKTYWAEPFIVDPEAVLIESQQLTCTKLEIYSHPNCRIVTPWDICVNRLKENSRGDLRHGSCGMGIYETIQRNKQVVLTISDCKDPFIVYKKLRLIEEYYHKNLIQNGFGEYFESLKKSISIDNFMIGINWINNNVIYMENPWKIQWDTVIFEGGQGLGLSQSNTKDFPHLTPSYTGSEEIVKLIGSRNISIFYVTRPYLTRHGAGPLPDENETLRTNVPHDNTNEPNDYQGNLRFAPLNVSDMKKRIQKDLNNYKQKPWVSIFMTQQKDGYICTPEYPDPIKDIVSNMTGIVDNLYGSHITNAGKVEVKPI